MNMHMTLENKVTCDVGRYECQMAKLEITYKPLALRLLSHLMHPQTPLKTQMRVQKWKQWKNELRDVF